jgi:hypothetical protein
VCLILRSAFFYARLEGWVLISMVRDGAPDSASALPEVPPHHEAIQMRPDAAAFSAAFMLQKSACSQKR